MRLGIMQPYFFPYLGYFSLLKHVDEFIILDDVQFIRHGWIERNRILKPQEGWQYFSVPLQKHSQKTLIRDIRINNSLEWKKKILAQLNHYKKALYYKEVCNLLEEIFEQDYESITELDMACLKKTGEYLHIDTPIRLFSTMGITIEPVRDADEWALNICKAVNGADEYWNPPGGQSFFDKEKYDRAGIRLCFQQVELRQYAQNRKTFESGLSILDVMMFQSPEQINKMLDVYELYE